MTRKSNAKTHKRPRSWADELERLALRQGVETDEHRLAQRQKQIDYGKNTIAYDRLSKLVPRSKRTREHPMTPPIRQKSSKRSFDGQVKKWRRMLHAYYDSLDDELKLNSPPAEGKSRKQNTQSDANQLAETRCRRMLDYANETCQRPQRHD